MFMDDKQKQIIKKVFFDLRRAERIIQRAIKKMTALDKMIKGEYNPEKNQASNNK